jgi:YD repeat-containing protein
VNVATDVNNATSTYTYGACGNSFATSIAAPLSLTTSQAWNCTGGVLRSTTDANNQTTTTTYNDPNFWRPTATTDPTSAVTNISYGISPPTSESVLNFNGTTSTVDQRVRADTLGRVHISQVRQAQGSANFDSIETDYDSLGRTSRVTVPYAGVAGQTNASAPATTTTYDALNRPVTVTDGGGGTATYSYSQNDVLVTIGPAAAGENAKARQLEYDALGRLTSVCEITTAAGSGTCGQNTVKVGYWTKYSYDAAGNLLTVTQNVQGTAQRRSFAYDGLGRITSEQNPESNGIGNTYTYDSDATCGTSSGDIVKRQDPDGNVTCYAHDALHRVTAITYPSGPYTTAEKHFVYDGATVNGIAMTNTKGRLANAYTGATRTTDLGFSYSPRGEVTDTYEATQHSCE